MLSASAILQQESRTSGVRPDCWLAFFLAWIYPGDQPSNGIFGPNCLAFGSMSSHLTPVAPGCLIEVMERDLESRIALALPELKSSGAREIYVFGSAVRGGATKTRDIDIAVSGLPPSSYYRVLGRLSRLLDCPVDLVDLDQPSPFTEHLVREGELHRVG